MRQKFDNLSVDDKRMAYVATVMAGTVHVLTLLLSIVFLTFAPIVGMLIFDVMCVFVFGTFYAAMKLSERKFPKDG